jgi:hypothetical protein
MYTIHTLKGMLRMYKVPGITNCKKSELEYKLKMYLSVRRIQKFLRSKWTLEAICPVSLEPIKYPLFAFKPKGHHLFIYYNLEIYSEYLINTGDFRDPKTREIYSDDVLKKIDTELDKNKIVVPLKGVYKASKNKRHYQHKKEHEDTLLLLDRCLDDVVSSLRSLIEKKKEHNQLLFMAFRSYFKRLVSCSREESINFIKRTINSINNSVKSTDNDTNVIRDNIILFLYQTQFDELGL